jgi:hypothetical protein
MVGMGDGVEFLLKAQTPSHCERDLVLLVLYVCSCVHVAQSVLLIMCCLHVISRASHAGTILNPVGKASYLMIFGGKTIDAVEYSLRYLTSI